jgi:hypothetical protein
MTRVSPEHDAAARNIQMRRVALQLKLELVKDHPSKRLINILSNVTEKTVFTLCDDCDQYVCGKMTHCPERGCISVKHAKCGVNVMIYRNTDYCKQHARPCSGWSECRSKSDHKAKCKGCHRYFCDAEPNDDGWYSYNTKCQLIGDRCMSCVKQHFSRKKKQTKPIPKIITLVIPKTSPTEPIKGVSNTQSVYCVFEYLKWKELEKISKTTPLFDRQARKVQLARFMRLDDDRKRSSVPENKNQKRKKHKKRKFIGPLTEHDANPPKPIPNINEKNVYDICVYCKKYILSDMIRCTETGCLTKRHGDCIYDYPDDDGYMICDDHFTSCNGCKYSRCDGSDTCRLCKKPYCNNRDPDNCGDNSRDIQCTLINQVCYYCILLDE